MVIDTHGSQIFHTGSDAKSGEEEKFPGPDNPSKMRRSVENAEHVGMHHTRSQLIPRKLMILRE